MTKKTTGTRKYFETVSQTVVVDWHKPMCSHCGEPIEEIGMGMAVWFVDDAGAFTNPGVVHIGALCSFYEDLRLGHIERPGGLRDCSLERCRRAGMAAIEVVLRARLSDEAERAVWRQWIGVVLGLTSSQWNLLAMLKVEGEVGEIVCKRVLSVDAIRRAQPRSGS